jgi:hypothetical protein
MMAGQESNLSGMGVPTIRFPAGLRKRIKWRWKKSNPFAGRFLY